MAYVDVQVMVYVDVHVPDIKLICDDDFRLDFDACGKSCVIKHNLHPL